MKIPISVLSLSIIFVGFAVKSYAAAETLADARRDFHTKLLRELSVGEPAVTPPRATGLKLVTYRAPVGNLAAYIGPLPKDGQRHPAIIWIAGGFSNSIGEIAWTPAPPANDQSASGFRATGIVTMYPSMRGGNNNPGNLEVCGGEVDDVLAAAAYLAKQPFVDPTRIYLGGHSAGGTLAMLVAEMPNPFRAVFALGPVDDIAGYGTDVLPFDPQNAIEGRVRSPMLWLQGIQTPTFIFEGERGQSNIGPMRKMARLTQNEHVHFMGVAGCDHFSLIFPFVRELAQKITQDTGDTCNIVIDATALAQKN